MNGNDYEERLGTDMMLPLVFKMALPAVAAQIANLLYSIVDRMYITRVHTVVADADAFFPEPDPGRWKEEFRSETMTDGESGISFEFTVYSRL